MNLIEATMRALQGKLEARNPENDEINSKISKTLNGSTKYMDDLDSAGLGVKVNDKGKADSIYNKAEDENNKNAKQPNDYVNVRTMTKQDLKNSNTDTDYYNYLTKNKVRPEVTDTGAFAPTNIFRNSNNFEKTIGSADTTYRQEDRNGVSKAIPKRYKTGNKNYNYDPDTFPKKDYNGVASYEPLDNKELKDFKYAKSQASDDGYLKRTMDKAKAEYDQAKADYDKVNNQVQDVRSRIAKSKANRKEEARSHKEDNEKAAPRGDFKKAPRYVKNSPYNEPDVPKRAKIGNGKPDENGSVWGLVDKDLIDTYEKSTPDIERYKEYKADAERERDNARYYNKLAKRSDDLASDIVRDRKLDRAERNLKGKQIFNVEEKKTESAEDTDAKNIKAIQDVLKKSGITSERTLDLMSKDILKDLKRNYTKGCKDEYGNYYGTVITDAFRKKVQQITGKMPDLKIGESKKIKEETIGRNRKIRKKVESLNAPVDDQAYWTYVLGYDFLQDYFKNSSEPECDLTFEKAWKIADDFMHSEEFQDTSKSGYDALVDYLKNKKLIESKITEDTKGETKKFTLQVSCGKDDAVITLDINKNAKFDDVIKTLKNELYDFPKNFKNLD